MGDHQMVLISYKEYIRLKRNSDNFLLQKSKASESDNKKGHGVVKTEEPKAITDSSSADSDIEKGHGLAEISEPCQLPNTEIPKQDVYQEKYAEAVLERSHNDLGVSDAWYYIGIPKCMEKN